MRDSCLRTLILFFLLGLPAFSQETAIARIGVAPLQSGSAQVPVTEARDRLVKALNQQKFDKKQRLSLEAVALGTSQRGKALAEARDKNCQFVVYSHLTDVLTSERFVPYGLQGGNDYEPVVTVRVEYRLSRVLDGEEFAVGVVNAEDSSSIREAVLQAMAQVAEHAVADLRKTGNAPLPEPATQVEVKAEVSPEPVELQYLASDFCKWLPGDVPHADALRGVCQFAITLPQKMPNFICSEETSRYRGENRVPRDLITAQVRYEDGNESYSEIKLNGKPAPRNISESPGLWSTGQFGGNLRSIFDLHNQALFEFSGENHVGTRAAWVFTYRIVRQNDPLWRLHAGSQVVAPPYGGELWVDQKTGELLRFQSVAGEVPRTFPMQAAELAVDYDNVAFGDGTSFLLPLEATVATQYRGQEAMRNVVRFRNCHKFRATAHMVLNAAIPESTGNPGTTSAAEMERELEENNKIYEILREEAVREDAARMERERIPELEAATVGALWKLSALEKERERYVAREEAAAKAAQPVTKEPLAAIKVKVSLVPVSVVLRDSKGRAVGSLHKEDFELFDSGKPQVITTFSMEKPGAIASAGNAPAESQGASAAPTAEASKPAERYVAYIFDDIHAAFEDLASARDAASRHLAALRPEDRAAIFTTSGNIRVDFTSDRERLQTAVRGLRPHAMLPASTCPPLSQYMADLIVNQGDLETLSLATQDTVACAFGGMASSPAELARAERIAKATAFEVLNAGSAETQSTVGVLRDTIRRMSALPGSDSIVLASPGFLTLTPQTRQAVTELIDTAVRAGIVVNSLDVKGLSTLGVSGDRSRPNSPARLQVDTAEASAQSDVMADLAYSTGGTFFHNNNDMDEGFRRTADTPEYIYILGFSPRKLDGKFHKLKVVLKPGAGNVPGKLTVQARLGYFALKLEAAQ